MGSSASRTCSSITNVKYYSEAGDDVLKWYEQPYLPANNSNNKRRNTNTNADDEGQLPNEINGRRFVKLLTIPKLNIKNDDDDDDTSNYDSNISIELEYIRLKDFKRSNANLVTLAKYGGLDYNAPEYTSFGAFARGVANINLYEKKPVNSQRFSVDPPLIKLDMDKPDIVKSIWMLELDDQIPVSQSSMVDVYSVLRNNCSVLVDDKSDNGDQEILLPVIGYMGSKTSPISLRSIIQEMIAFGVYCAEKSTSKSLKRIVFYVPNVESFNAIKSSVYQQKSVNQKLENMDYIDNLPNVDFDSLITRCRKWIETFDDLRCHHSQFFDHLEYLLRSWDQYSEVALSDCLSQKLFLICDASRQLGESFLNQYANIIPGWYQIKGQDHRLRALRFNPIHITKKGKDLSFEPNVDDDAQSTSSASRPFLTKFQYEHLQVMNRIGCKPSQAEQVNLINVADALFALSSIVYILSIINTPSNSASNHTKHLQISHSRPNMKHVPSVTVMDGFYEASSIKNSRSNSAKA